MRGLLLSTLISAYLWAFLCSDMLFGTRERQEHKVFLSLLKSVPGLEEKLMCSDSEEEVHSMAVMVSTFTIMLLFKAINFPQLQKGVSSARSDDTKSLKSAIIDWLTPPGEPLIPPIPCNVKIGRGFNHEATGALLCPVGVDWSNSQ